MSTRYEHPNEVPLDVLISRLIQLSSAVVNGKAAKEREFTVRIPAECDRDPDIVLSEAAVRLRAMRDSLAELQAFVDAHKLQAGSVEIIDDDFGEGVIRTRPINRPSASVPDGLTKLRDAWRSYEAAVATYNSKVEEAWAEPLGDVSVSDEFSAMHEAKLTAIQTLRDSADAVDAMLTATPRPAPSAPEGMDEFLADLTRSRTKYPNNARMFDGLLGEVDELRRAYHGDGDVRAEAFDVAVCAFRIAVEGDSGGNTLITPPHPRTPDENVRVNTNTLYHMACGFRRREPQTSASVPDDLRAKGLTVAVHNDYQLNGNAHTFWLLTGSDGMSYKGEGRTDAEALNAVRALLTTTPQPASDRWMLAPKHSGMMVSGSGILNRVGGPLKFGAREMLRHLNEMSDRFYSGDVKAVDEFLQCYCLDDKRPNPPTDQEQSS